MFLLVRRVYFNRGIISFGKESFSSGVQNHSSVPSVRYSVYFSHSCPSNTKSRHHFQHPFPSQLFGIAKKQAMDIGLLLHGHSRSPHTHTLPHVSHAVKNGILLNTSIRSMQKFCGFVSFPNFHPLLSWISLIPSKEIHLTSGCIIV